MCDINIYLCWREEFKHNQTLLIAGSSHQTTYIVFLFSCAFVNAKRGEEVKRPSLFWPTCTRYWVIQCEVLGHLLLGQFIRSYVRSRDQLLVDWMDVWFHKTKVVFCSRWSYCGQRSFPAYLRINGMHKRSHDVTKLEFLLTIYYILFNFWSKHAQFSSLPLSMSSFSPLSIHPVTLLPPALLTPDWWMLGIPGSSCYRVTIRGG